MTSVPIARSPKEAASIIGEARLSDARVALTPTMGALHRGHLSLVELARSKADFVVASIFVNPAQFAPNEDFQTYPRDEARDVELLASIGCDLIYAPPVAAMYPAEFSTSISVAGVADPLEGAFRPHHFSGVATVVAKLLTQCRPDLAVFGEKDYQQLQVIRRLVCDLDLGVEIVGAPIVRENDGLALSSRNAYLSPPQRRIAPFLYGALETAAGELSAGTPVSDVEAHAGETLHNAGFDAVDYFEAREPGELARLGPGPLTTSARILAAAWIGRTRLIDNVALHITTPQAP